MRRALRAGAGVVGAAAACVAAAPARSFVFAEVPSTAAAPATPPGLEHYKLAQVHVLFRHGARAPLSTMHGSGEEAVASCERSRAAATALLVRSVDGTAPPQSKGNTRQSATVLPGGCHLGQLSDVGWQQAEAVGELLRKRYSERLSLTQATTPAVSVRSSNLQRTIATAEGVLLRLFPEQSSPVVIAVATDEAEW